MADDIDVDFFISLVEARPVLWDKTSENYKDKYLKTEGWKDVCRNIFESFDDKDSKEKTKLGNDIIKKWTNIKDNFMKYLKKKELANKSGAGRNKLKEYHLYKQLMFLKKNEANLTDSSILDEESEDPKTSETTRSRYQPQTTTSRKRKYSDDDFEKQVLETLKRGENRHVSFFKSILPFLEKLDDHQTMTYQSRVMQILTEINQPTYYQYNQPSYSSYETALQSSYQRSQQATETHQPPRNPSYTSIHGETSSNRSTEDISNNLSDILSNTQESEYDFPKSSNFLVQNNKKH